MSPRKRRITTPAHSPASVTRRAPRKQPERELAKACTDFLCLDGWRPFSMETVYDKERKRGTGEEGMADYLYLRYGPNTATAPQRAKAEVFWIEWKSKRGSVKTHQKLWHSAERSRGALTAIVKVDFDPTVDSFLHWYQTSGLARRVFGKVATAS